MSNRLQVNTLGIGKAWLGQPFILLMANKYLRDLDRDGESVDD